MEPQDQAFVRRDASISLGKANIYSLLAVVPLAILMIFMFSFIWGTAAWISGLRSLTLFPLVWLFLFLGGIVVHELLHAVMWSHVAGKPWRVIRFGFDLKTVTPFAHCTEPMQLRAYRWGAVAPGVILGIIPSFAGIITGNATVMIFGTVFTLAAGGDFLILWLLRSVPAAMYVEDHPSRAGCYILEPTAGQEQGNREAGTDDGPRT